LLPWFAGGPLLDGALPLLGAAALVLFLKCGGTYAAIIVFFVFFSCIFFSFFIFEWTEHKLDSFGNRVFRELLLHTATPLPFSSRRQQFTTFILFNKIN
jgi:hypothetical protein